MKRKLKETEDKLAEIAKEEAKTPEAEGLHARKEEAAGMKAQLEAQLAEQDQEQAEVKMPPNVKDKDRLNLILIGPEKSGKTSVANYL